MAVDIRRLRRYRSQSLRLLESAFQEMRSGRWPRCEELLWGSLSLAVKGVALSRGEIVGDQESVKAYALRLGLEQRDRRIRDGFEQLAALGDAIERVRESHARVDHFVRMLEDVSSAVGRLWQMVPGEGEDALGLGR